MNEEPEHELSPDGMTLVIKRRVASGVQTLTYRHRTDAGPFTEEDIAWVLGNLKNLTAAERMLPGQRNTTHQVITRFGIIWLDVMRGPPTWRKPRLEFKKDGTVMAGWLRRAVAVKFEKKEGSHESRS